MESLTPADAKALEELTKQRAEHQISEYKFEEAKRLLLGQEPIKAPWLLNTLILLVIFALLLLGSILAYPELTHTFFSVLFSMIWGMFTDFGDNSVLAIPDKVRDYKESNDAMSDRLFADPVSWKK